MASIVPEYSDRTTAANTLAIVYHGPTTLTMAGGQNASGADAFMQVWDGDPLAGGVLLYSVLAADKGTVLFVPAGESLQKPGRPIANDLRVGWSLTEHTFTGVLGRFNVFSYNVYP
jgi:hypothetical protein